MTNAEGFQYSSARRPPVLIGPPEHPLAAVKRSRRDLTGRIRAVRGDIPTRPRLTAAEIARRAVHRVAEFDNIETIKRA